MQPKPPILWARLYTGHHRQHQDYMHMQALPLHVWGICLHVSSLKMLSVVACTESGPHTMLDRHWPPAAQQPAANAPSSWVRLCKDHHRQHLGHVDIQATPLQVEPTHLIGSYLVI